MRDIRGSTFSLAAELRNDADNDLREANVYSRIAFEKEKAKRFKDEPKALLELRSNTNS